MAKAGVITRRRFLSYAAGTGLGLASARTVGGFLDLSALESARGAQKIALSVLYLSNGEFDRKGLQEILDAYQRRNPNVSVQLELTTLPKQPEAIQARITSRDLPDIAYIVGNRAPAYNKLGVLADISAYLPRRLGDEFVPYRWSEVQYGSKIVGVPGSHGVRGLAYNVDYFKKAGIEAPRVPEQTWTWDKLIEVAQRLMKTSDAKFGLMFEDNSFDQWAGILYQAGATMLTPDMSAPAIDSPEALEALEWAIELHRKKIAPIGVTEGTERPLPLFTSGASAMWMSGAWMIPTLEQQMNRYRYSFTFLPRKKRTGVLTTGGTWVVFRTRKVKEAAHLLTFLASQENITKMAGIRAQNSARKRTTGLKWSGRNELVAFFTKQAEAGFQPQLQREQLHPFYGATRDALAAEAGLAVSGQKTAKQALKDMAAIIAKALR